MEGEQDTLSHLKGIRKGFLKERMGDVCSSEIRRLCQLKKVIKCIYNSKGKN